MAVAGITKLATSARPDRRFQGVIMRIAWNGCSMRASGSDQDHAELASAHAFVLSFLYGKLETVSGKHTRHSGKR
jgi:hypothetical protein